jgi:hypothetical protein
VAEVLKTFFLDYFVCGLVPFDESSIAVLGYVHTDEDDDEREHGSDPVPQRPEIRLKDRHTVFLPLTLTLTLILTLTLRP